MAGKVSDRELIQAVLDALRPSLGGDGLTTEELAEMTGYNARKVRRALKRLKREGRVVTTFKLVQFLDDRVAPIAAYCLKEEGGG